MQTPSFPDPFFQSSFIFQWEKWLPPVSATSPSLSAKTQTPLTSLDASLPNSFTVTVAPAPFPASAHQPPHRYVFENILVQSNYQANSASWHVVENPYFTLVVDGHLYLQAATTLDARQNADDLLQRITVTSVEKGIEEIAGGMFNLLIIDKSKKKMVVIGDRWGSMPLFFLKTRDEFHLSGNQFAFRNVASLFDAAVVEFLRYGYLPFSASLFLNVDRLLPGQKIEVWLETNQIHVTPPAVFEFKPVNHRITLLSDAVEMLHQAFLTYFSRFSSRKLSMELDGGLDTRLLFAWSKNASPSLLYFEQPGDKYEKKIVRKIARQGNANLQTSRFTPEVLHQYIPRVTATFRLMHSLEYIRTAHMHHAVCSLAPTHYLSAFMGKSVMGTILTHMENAEANAAYRANPRTEYNTPIREILYYQNMLYNLPHSLSNRDMEGILLPDIEVWLLNACRGILEVNRNAGHIHEDFVEALHNYTQARGLWAATAVALSHCTQCLSLFSDYKVSQVAFDIDKQLRSEHRLYHHYWRTYYPEFASIPDTYSQEHSNEIASSSGMMGKIRSIFHKTGSPADTRAHYREILGYLMQGSNDLKTFLEELTQTSNPGIPPFIARRITELATRPDIDERLFIRYISLIAYLSPKV